MHLQNIISLLSLSAAASASVLGSAHHQLQQRNASGSVDPRNTAYYANYDIYSEEYLVTDIPATNLTHLIYFSANVNSTTGEAMLSDDYADLEYLYPGDNSSAPGNNVHGNIKQLFLLKKKQRNLKTMLCIGGAGAYSDNMGTVLAKDTLRQAFADSAVYLLSNLGFDGIDIDYESVSNTTQAEQFVDLLKKLRIGLDNFAATISAETSFSLSFAAPMGSADYDLLDIPAMDEYLDFWNFMGYDYAGPWDTISGHQANLFNSTTNPDSTPLNSNDSINYYIANGATPSKLNLGCPLYGTSFNNTKGPGTAFDGVGSLGSYGEAGTWYDGDLPVAGFNATVYKLPEIGAAYSYDPVNEYMISYDTPKVASVKAQYILNNSLGGLMWFEVSMDNTGSESLIGAAANTFGGQNALDQTLNNLNYPTSKYDNLRDQFD